jgi:hypothetical protein
MKFKKFIRTASIYAFTNTDQPLYESYLASLSFYNPNLFRDWIEYKNSPEYNKVPIPNKDHLPYLLAFIADRW